MNQAATHAEPIDPALKAAGCDLVEGSKQPFASKYRTLLPTEAELIAELERERRVIEHKQNGGDT